MNFTCQAKNLVSKVIVIETLTGYTKWKKQVMEKKLSQAVK